MDMTSNSMTIFNQLKSWKLYAVLYGTYFRFHPWISVFATKVAGHFRSEDHVRNLVVAILQESLNRRAEAENFGAEDLVSESSSAPSDCKAEFVAELDAWMKDAPSNKSNILDAVGALLLVSGDAIAGHLLSTLFFLASDEHAVVRLRCEINSLGTSLSDPPTLQELFSNEAHLVFLRSVLQESQRMQGREDFYWASLTPVTNDHETICGRPIPAHVTNTCLSMWKLLTKIHSVLFD